MHDSDYDFTVGQGLSITTVSFAIALFVAWILATYDHRVWAASSVMVGVFLFVRGMRRVRRIHTRNRVEPVALRAPFQDDIYLNDLTDQMLKAVETARKSIKSLSPDTADRLRRIAALETAGYDYIDELYATTPHDPLWSIWQQQRVAWRKLFEYYRESLERAVARQKETKQ